MEKHHNIQVTYICKINPSKNWKNWKYIKDCSKEELELINLRQIFPNEIILDFEDKIKLEEIKNLFNEQGYNYYIYDTGSRGFHIHLFFSNLDCYDKEIRTEIRKLFIKRYEADETKASENTLIAIEDRPHFKTGNNKILIEALEGENVLDEEIIQEAMRIINFKKTNPINITDDTFKEYHLKDKFFNYIKENEIPDGSFRDMIIFPNVAIALVKEGLNEKQIEEIMKPIIKENFKGKTYSEFKGWVNKAINNIIQDYNPIQINQWVKSFTNLSDDIYDLKPISLESNKKRFITDAEFENSPDEPIQWLIDGWIAKGDICGIVGKMSSFKTTLVLHLCYALAEGNLIFNKYQCRKSKVLYLNEENHKSLFRIMTRRVKKGLDIGHIKSENLFLCNMDNIKLENSNDIKDIINCVNENKIDVIVFDSIRRFFVGKENEADVIAKVMNTLKLIRKDCNDCSIINIHHSKKGDSEDDRDIARGSSDWGNSLDSEIQFKRKLNSNKVIINHIKNRSGPELNGRIIQIDMADDKTYIWESGEVIPEEAKRSKPEECSEKLIEFLTEKRLTTFARKDINEIENIYNYDTITKAIRLLKADGVLIENGIGKRLIYIFNQPIKSEEEDEL